MRRLVTLSILAIVGSPFGVALMFLIYVIIDVVHGYKRRRPIAPISRAHRTKFETEGAQIQARLIAQGEAAKACRVDPYLAS